MIKVNTRVGKKINLYDIEVTGDTIIRFRGGNVTTEDFEFDAGSANCYYWQLMGQTLAITVSVGVIRAIDWLIPNSVCRWEWTFRSISTGRHIRWSWWKWTKTKSRTAIQTSLKSSWWYGLICYKFSVIRIPEALQVVTRWIGGRKSRQCHNNVVTARVNLWQNADSVLRARVSPFVCLLIMLSFYHFIILSFYHSIM